MSNVQEKHAWDDLSDSQKIEVLKKKIETLESEMQPLRPLLGYPVPKEWGG